MLKAKVDNRGAYIEWGAKNVEQGELAEFAESRKKQGCMVDRWNEKRKAGEEVVVTKDDGSEIITQTTSEATLLGGHTAVIWLKDISGCYALERVRPRRDVVYERWLDFALRLANVGDMTSRRREKLTEEISNFITMYGDPHQYGDKPILGWDDSIEDWICIGSHADEYFEEYCVYNRRTREYMGNFLNQILSRIRAGLDVAVPDMHGGGVIGFTIGDIRKMYGGNIPQWVLNTLELKGKEPDDEPIWL